MTRIFFSTVTGMLLLAAIVILFTAGFHADAIAGTESVVSIQPTPVCRTVAVTIADPFSGAVGSMAQDICTQR